MFCFGKLQTIYVFSDKISKERTRGKMHNWKKEKKKLKFKGSNSSCGQGCGSGSCGQGCGSDRILPEFNLRTITGSGPLKNNKDPDST